ENTFYFVPADVSFKCHCTQEVDHFYVHFDIRGLPRLVLQSRFSAPICVPPSRPLDEMFSMLLEDIISRKNELGMQLRLKALILEALVLCLPVTLADQVEQDGQVAEPPEMIQPALAYVQTHLAMHIKMNDLAAQCNMSKDYFIRRFRQSMGITPLQY